MPACPSSAPGIPRKAPAAEQYNWVTGAYEVEAEQQELPFELTPPEDVWKAEEAGAGVQLLATENGAQLLVSGFGLSLGKKSERVTMRLKGKICGELPLFRLQEIVVMGRGVSVSTDLLEEACVRGIRVAFVSPTWKPFALVTSPYLTATLATRRAQLAAAGNVIGAEMMRWIVAGKLHNQEKLLRYFGKSRTGESGERLAVAAERLRSLRREVLGLEGDDPERVRGSAMGLEGAGGREYWGALAETLRPELGFVRRVHEQPEDGVNASLNYGYGILYSHVWGAVMNAGLEPFAGFLHGERAGKPSMVLDMIEEFRQPVVDRPLMAWFFKGGTPRMERGLLDEGTREEVATRVLTRLNTAEPHRGKSHQVRSIIQMQARLAASAVRGLKKYRPFAFKW